MNTIYELVKLARDGDREALADLVELLRPRLFGEAYFCLRHYHDAQDAVASALLRSRCADVTLSDDDLLGSHDYRESDALSIDTRPAQPWVGLLIYVFSPLYFSLSPIPFSLISPTFAHMPAR